MSKSIPKITQDMISFVTNWSKLCSEYTIVRITHEGKSRNLWIDIKDVNGKDRNQVADMLQKKANRAFEEK